MQNVIFWYTGIFVWSIIAILIFAVVVAMAGYFLYELWEARHSWDGIRQILNIPVSDDKEMHKNGNMLFRAAEIVGIEATRKQMIDWLIKYRQLCSQRNL